MKAKTQEGKKSDTKSPAKEELFQGVKASTIGKSGCGRARTLAMFNSMSQLCVQMPVFTRRWDVKFLCNNSELTQFATSPFESIRE